MIKLIQTETHELTPKLAQEFHDMKAVPGERLLNPRRTKTQLDWIRSGIFCGVTWSTVQCLENGLLYRGDGQHSSDLLVKLPDDVPFPSGLKASIARYEVDTVAELAAAFDLFNNPMSVRNTEDKVGLFLANYPDMREFQDSSAGRRFVLHMLNGINLFEMHPPTGKRGRSVAVRDRGGYLGKEQYRLFVRWASDFRDTKGHKFLGRPGVVQEMLADWLTSEEPATTFWTHTFCANHPSPDHPSRQLYDNLSRMLERSKRYGHAEFKREANRAWRRFTKSTSDTRPAEVELSFGDFTRSAATAESHPD